MLSPVHDLAVGVWRGRKEGKQREQEEVYTSKAIPMAYSALFAYDVYTLCSTQNVQYHTLWSFRAKWWETWCIKYNYT